MTMNLSPIYNDDLFGEFVRKHQLAVESLTEKQLAQAIRQAVSSGDFVRHVRPDGAQSVVYLPGREVEELRAKYHELVFAVSRKHDGETRHDTALRYIREAEETSSATGDECKNTETP